MSAFVTTITKAVPTVRVKIEPVENIDFRIEPVGPSKSKPSEPPTAEKKPRKKTAAPKFQLVRPGHPVITGTEEVLRKRGRELIEETRRWKVSARGYSEVLVESEDRAELEAEKIRKASAVTYSAELLPATEGLKIVPRLLSLFGPALTAFFMSPSGAVEELLKDPKVIAQVVARLAERAAETDGLMVLKDLFKGVQADKVRVGEIEIPAAILPDHFDDHFRGRFGHLVEVALWVAKENFLEP